MDPIASVRPSRAVESITRPFHGSSPQPMIEPPDAERTPHCGPSHVIEWRSRSSTNVRSHSACIASSGAPRTNSSPLSTSVVFRSTFSSVRASELYASTPYSVTRNGFVVSASCAAKSWPDVKFLPG